MWVMEKNLPPNYSNANGECVFDLILYVKTSFLNIVFPHGRETCRGYVNKTDANIQENTCRFISRNTCIRKVNFPHQENFMKTTPQVFKYS